MLRDWEGFIDTSLVGYTSRKGWWAAFLEGLEMALAKETSLVDYTFGTDLGWHCLKEFGLGIHTSS